MSLTIEKETLARMALGKLFMNQPRIPREIITNLGSAATIFELPVKEVYEIVGPIKEVAFLKNALKDAERIIPKLEIMGGKYISDQDPDYPPLLLEIPDAPLGLYVLSGDQHPLSHPDAVSIVGTRDCSSYGRDQCRKIVENIAAANPKCLIVSGLAKGIDITSHLTALENGLPTVAVMGTAIDKVFPAAHEAYADKIASTKHCAVISEYPPGANILATTFLMRNRIVAALSQSTIVVESKIKGGSMSTARLAFEYGRNLFAVPGRLDDESMEGCNYLIHQQMANIIPDMKSLITGLGFDNSNIRNRGNIRTRINEIVTKKYSKDPTWENKSQIIGEILLYIAGHRDCTMDEIMEAFEMPYSTASTILTLLEKDGIIESNLLGMCSLRE